VLGFPLPVPDLLNVKGNEELKLLSGGGLGFDARNQRGDID